MNRLKPLFSYYGSKWRLAPEYPMPTKKTIIEPFAGSACFSLCYPHKKVKLFDKYDKICSLWEYLIGVSEREVLDLPMLKAGQEIPSNLPEGARLLIGFWAGKGLPQPRKTLSTYSDGKTDFFWSEKYKHRIAAQLQYIRHWTIEQKSYNEIDNEDAYWFIDPPYVTGGHKYYHPSKNIDYHELGQWCKSRKGEVVVCENNTADWLPFRDFKNTIGLQNTTREIVWTKGLPVQQSLFGGAR